MVYLTKHLNRSQFHGRPHRLLPADNALASPRLVALASTAPYITSEQTSLLIRDTWRSSGTLYASGRSYDLYLSKYGDAVILDSLDR